MKVNDCSDKRSAISYLMFIDEGFFFTSLSICSKPFLKERSSDDSSHASAIINLLTELGRSIKFL